MKAFCFIFLLVTLRCAFAQPDAPAEKIAPRFQFELANTAAPDSTLSRMLACVSVLHGELTFLPAIIGFEAEYQITLEVLNTRSEVVAKREEQTRLHAHDLAEAHSREKYAFHRFVFDLSPGEYSIRLMLNDHVSNRQTNAVRVKALRNFEAAPSTLVLSDALWFERANGEESGYEPMLFENMTNPNRELALYLEILSPDVQAPLYVQQVIRNAREEIVLQQQRVWPRKGALEKLFLPIGTELLPYGSYHVELLIQQKEKRHSVQASFRLAWDGIPSTALHLNHALAAAKYIANEDESHVLQAAREQTSLTEKQNTLRSFWQARDTSSVNTLFATSASFYQRLVEAEDKFGGEKLGWQTDLGRVYLTHGAPDEIEIQTKAKTPQPFQVWRYRNQQKEFLFIDRKGLGLYQLAIGED